MSFKNSLVICEGNTKQISTMTVSLQRILMNIEFYIKERGILYKISS